MVDRTIELHDLVNQSKAAELIGVSRVTLWKWIRLGKLQPVIVGGMRMVPQSEVERLKKGRDKELEE